MASAVNVVPAPETKFYFFHAVRGGAAGSTEGETIIKGWVNQSSPSNPKQCSAHVGETFKTGPLPDNAPCLNPCTLDARYCAHHLLAIKQLTIAPSRFLAQLGIEALGLYAGKPSDANKPQSERPIVFSRGTLARSSGKKKRWKKGHEPAVISSYGGEEMKLNKFNMRYDYYDDEGKLIKPTAPYASYNVRADKVYDGAIHRHAAVYANHGSSSHGFPFNSRFLFPDQDPRPVLVATQNIRAGTEILVAYSKEYWECVSPKYIQFRTAPYQASMFVNSALDEDDMSIEFPPAADAMLNFKHPVDLRHQNPGRKGHKGKKRVNEPPPARPGTRKSRRSDTNINATANARTNERIHPHAYTPQSSHFYRVFNFN